MIDNVNFSQKLVQHPSNWFHLQPCQGLYYEQVWVGGGSHARIFFPRTNMENNLHTFALERKNTQSALCVQNIWTRILELRRVVPRRVSICFVVRDVTLYETIADETEIVLGLGVPPLPGPPPKKKQKKMSPKSD